MVYLSKKATVWLILFAVITIGVLFVVYLYYLSPTGPKARESSDLGIGVGGDEVRYVNLSGETIELEEFSSQILIINFWASWSPFTNADHTTLHELKNTYGESITIRALNRMESRETGEAYLEAIGKKDGIEYIVDTTDHFYKAHGGYAMPETLVFDRKGTLVEHIRGTLRADEFSIRVKDLIEVNN
jgi:thiol-disulfide isomerase/thioredoxin